jgi:hypothetical protein
MAGSDTEDKVDDEENEAKAEEEDEEDDNDYAPSGTRLSFRAPRWSFRPRCAQTCIGSRGE